MKRILVRGLRVKLERKRRERARRERASLNAATVRPMRRGTRPAAGEKPQAVVGDALDPFIGRWSEADERELLASIAACEVVDASVWR